MKSSPKKKETKNIIFNESALLLTKTRFFMEEKQCSSCVKEPTEKINVLRFIDKLDSLLKRNNIQGAKECLMFWEEEARKKSDSCGLLSVLNEEAGFYRRTRDKENGLKAAREALKLINEKSLENNVSGATVYVNVATTFKAFGNTEEGLPLYDKAEEIYLKNGMSDSYEYAALLNNKATALADAEKFDEAENPSLLRPRRKLLSHRKNA